MKTERHSDAVRAYQEQRGRRHRRAGAFERLQGAMVLAGAGIVKPASCPEGLRGQPYTDADVSRMAAEISRLEGRL